MPGGEHQVEVVVEAGDRYVVLQSLSLLQPGKEVHNGPALGMPPGHRDAVRLELVHTSAVGEEQEDVVRHGDEQVNDALLLLGLHPQQPLATAVLLLVGVERQPLDVAVAGDHDDHLLIGYEVLDVQLPVVDEDLGLAVITVALPHLQQLALDDGHDLADVGQDLLEPADRLLELGVLLAQLLDLQSGEGAQAHLQDGLGLDIVQLEALHEPEARLLAVGRSPDDADGVIDGVDGPDQADQYVMPLLRLAQIVLGALGDHRDAVVEVGLQHLLQGEHLGLVVHQGQVDHAERHLQLGVLE